jgi:hypothetical protein
VNDSSTDPNCFRCSSDLVEDLGSLTYRIAS